MRSSPLFAAIGTLLLLLVGTALAAPSSSSSSSSSSHQLERRQWTESKYCNPTSGLCYLQVQPRGSTPLFRIALPDTASPPFDTILEITSPAVVTWAGFAWGGSMTANPLTVIWFNAGKPVVSSRWSTARTIPGMYTSATYKVLSSSQNSTHWSAEVACTGCSRWTGGQINPSGTTLNGFAWALSRNPVSTPSSPSSSFGIHQNVGTFTEPLTLAKNPASSFQNYIRTKAV